MRNAHSMQKCTKCTKYAKSKSYNYLKDKTISWFHSFSCIYKNINWYIPIKKLEAINKKRKENYSVISYSVHHLTVQFHITHLYKLKNKERLLTLRPDNLKYVSLKLKLKNYDLWIMKLLTSTPKNCGNMIRIVLGSER